MSGRQPSALVSTGLAAATVALNVAGAATDAVPIAKQILNSAAHISAFAERIHKKREAMYTLIRKVEVYSTQIDLLVAGRVLDARLQQRLRRLLAVFVKIEALVDEKLAWKNYHVNVWQKFIAKPNRAEELAVELDHVMTLFNLLTGIQLSLVIDDTAHTVAEDAGYDGQFRRLRDCDVEKLDVIHKLETDTGVIVWSSARVDSQLMVVRHVESLTTIENDDVAVSRLRQQSLPAFYFEYLKNIEKVSTISGSHRHIVQLYGRHVRGPEAVFRSGTINFDWHLRCLRDEEGNGEGEEVAVKRLGLAYKLLDASSHLSNAHGLRWVGGKAIVDEHGEPHIGLFDDIIRADSGQLPSDLPIIYWDIFPWFNSRSTEETGVVEQVHNTLLQAIISQQLGNSNSTDRVQRVWDIIRQAQLHVVYMTSTFPIISRNLPLAQELIMRARLFFETHLKRGDPYLEAVISFVRHVVAGGGGANISSRICIYIWRLEQDTCKIGVATCTHDDNHIRFDRFRIYIPTTCALFAEVARAAGLPDDFEQSWDGYPVRIDQPRRNGGEYNCNEISDLVEGDRDHEKADDRSLQIRRESRLHSHSGGCTSDPAGKPSRAASQHRDMVQVVQDYCIGKGAPL